jgi:hypothetical protein
MATVKAAAAVIAAKVKAKYCAFVTPITFAITVEADNTETIKTFMAVPFRELCLRVIQLSSMANSLQSVTQAATVSMPME